MQESSPCFNLLSIDPGTTTVGYALLSIEVASLDVEAARAWTVDTRKMTHHSQWDEMLYGDRFARVKKHGEIFWEYLNQFQPTIIACEAPFYNPRRPGAYGSLLECIYTFRHVLYRWDKWAEFHLIDSALAKKSIGVPGNSGDKELVKKKLLECTEYKGLLSGEFDEHAADALAIAKCRLDKFKDKLS